MFSGSMKLVCITIVCYHPTVSSFLFRSYATTTRITLVCLSLMESWVVAVDHKTPRQATGVTTRVVKQAGVEKHDGACGRYTRDSLGI